MRVGLVGHVSPVRRDIVRVIEDEDKARAVVRDFLCEHDAADRVAGAERSPYLVCAVELYARVRVVAVDRLATDRLPTGAGEAARVTRYARDLRRGRDPVGRDRRRVGLTTSC